MKHDRALARWREGEAIRLRLEGLNYEEISMALGYRSRASAWKAVDRALHRVTVDNVDKFRTQALVESMIIQEAAWKAACEGRSGAIKEVFKAIDLRVKVLGLAPIPDP